MTQIRWTLAIAAALLAGFGAGLGVGYRLPREPHNRADCLLRYLKPGLSTPATGIIYDVCKQKFPT